MTVTLSIATTADRDLVIAALRTAADQRTRVARRASADVMADKHAGKDPRSGAVKVTALLDEANRLAELAAQLEDAPALVVITPGVTAVSDGTGGLTATGRPADTGDGTSAQAQALAELAGLTPADPDAPDPVEDPLTNELPEDRAGDVDDAATLALDKVQP